MSPDLNIGVTLAFFHSSGNGGGRNVYALFTLNVPILSKLRMEKEREKKLWLEVGTFPIMNTDLEPF